MSWTSLHSGHAIERVRVEIHFSEALPTKIVDRIGASFDPKRSEIRFEPRAEHQVANFAIAENGAIAIPTTGPVPMRKGWRSVRLSGPNQPIEALTFEPNSMTYESADYRGWDKAVVRFKKVFGGLLAEAGRAVNANIVILDYMDRFFFQGKPQDADPTQLLRGELLPQIPDQIRSGQDLWHVHRGWFEYFEGDKYLVSQNLDAQDGAPQPDQVKRSVQIYTKLELRAAEGGLEMAMIDAKLEHMHNRCNGVVRDALIEGVARKVGLMKEGEVTNG